MRQNDRTHVGARMPPTKFIRSITVRLYSLQHVLCRIFGGQLNQCPELLLTVREMATSQQPASPGGCLRTLIHCKQRVSMSSYFTMHALTYRDSWPTPCRCCNSCNSRRISANSSLLRWQICKVTQSKRSKHSGIMCHCNATSMPLAGA